jgi:hypothetical protein
MRTDQMTVTFTRPFTLSTVGGLQPAGTYLVVTEQKPVEESSSPGHRRVATMMHLPADPSPGQTRQVVEVDPEELAAALQDNGDGEDSRPEGRNSAASSRGAVGVNYPRTSIRVVLRHGIWQLTRSGSFYGDYLTQREAYDAARDIAEAAAARGEWIEVQLDEDAPPS